MFDPTSRYASIETATFVMADGREVRYVKRRFLPDGSKQPLLTEMTVAQDERLDLITYRTLGEPTQFWRIADANNATDPLDLVERAGERIRVAVPQPETEG